MQLLSFDTDEESDVESTINVGRPASTDSEESPNPTPAASPAPPASPEPAQVKWGEPKHTNKGHQNERQTVPIERSKPQAAAKPQCKYVLPNEWGSTFPLHNSGDQNGSDPEPSFTKETPDSSECVHYNLNHRRPTQCCNPPLWGLTFWLPRSSFMSFLITPIPLDPPQTRPGTAEPPSKHSKCPCPPTGNGYTMHCCQALSHSTHHMGSSPVAGSA